MTSLVELHGYSADEALIKMKPREGEETLRTEDILELIEEQGSQIAVVMFPGIQYYTGMFLIMSCCGL